MRSKLLLNTKASDRRIMQGLAICSALATAFYIFGGLIYHAWGPGYLIFNLVLAYIPWCLTYPFATSLELAVRRRNPKNYLFVAGWGLLWLGFLPNTFYLITDMTHLADTWHGLPLLYAAMMFGVFAAVGTILGFMSVYKLHRIMWRFMNPRTTYLVILLIILLSSLAIYLGNVLRWNTWDLVLHPIAVIRAVVSTLAQPDSGSAAMILWFFLLLTGLYAAIWRIWPIEKK
jgi:uncharacterized membrane protein